MNPIVLFTCCSEGVISTPLTRTRPRSVGDPGEHADRRALTGAVGPEETEDLALLDLEVEPVDGPQPLGAAAEDFDEGLGADGGFGHGLQARKGALLKEVSLQGSGEETQGALSDRFDDGG